MIEKENELINQFYQSFWLYLFAAIGFIILAILVLVFKNKLLKKYNKTVISKMTLYSIACLMIIVGIFFSIITCYYSKDLKYVKQNEFYTVTGTVVGYSRTVSAGDIASEIIYYYPVIREDETGKTLRLNVTGTELGKRYTFLYLPNSRLAVIVTEIV